MTLSRLVVSPHTHHNHHPDIYSLLNVHILVFILLLLLIFILLLLLLLVQYGLRNSRNGYIPRVHSSPMPDPN